MKTHILLVLCGMVLLASPVWADVTADFTDGNDDETYVDAFHGIPGDGWTTPWEENVGVHGSAGGNEIVTNTVTDTNPIFEAGNKYLSSTVDANGELDVRFAAARNHGGIGRYTPRTIEFTFRLDEDVDGEGSTFTVYQDRYMIFDSYAARDTASSVSTWCIFGYAGTGTYCPEGRQMEWTFCSGTNHPNGNMSGATFADTNVPLVGGAVYHFSVFLDTVTETWDASVSTTIDTVEYSYNSTTDYPDGMGWRDSTINGSYAYFSSRTYHADDVRAFSVDGIKITPEPPPGGRTIVEAHFSGQPEEVDGYPGIPGEGWKSAWEYAVYNDASGEPTVLSDSPLKPGEGSGNYLQVDTTHPYQEDPDVVSYAGARRNYKPFDAPGIDWSKDYTVQFSVRVDENLAGGDFNHVDDRYQFSELDNGYNADTSATWLVSMFGGASDPEAEDPIANAEDVGVWVFYDGGRDREARDAERNVASDIVAITGVVYDFTIEVDPETQSYVATVSDGTDSFTTGTLGWWTSCFEVGGLLVFDTRAGDVVDDFTPEHRIFSLDDVVITQSIEEVPGDTDDDGDVDADDLATLAGNWGASVTPGDVTAGDFDGDGIVGPEDASILAAHWGHGTGEASGTSVPEPCMAMLVGIGLAMLVIRRTRR